MIHTFDWYHILVMLLFTFIILIVSVDMDEK